MSTPLTTRIADAASRAGALYHSLVLVVGPGGSGKTAALQQLQREKGWRLINLNLSLSERLLDMTARQRPLRLAGALQDIIGDRVERRQDPVLLDNIELLFHPSLRQDPLRLLQRQARSRVVIATWRGAMEGGSLTYATHDHPEHCRYHDPEAIIVLTESEPISIKTTANDQEPRE